MTTGQIRCIIMDEVERQGFDLNDDEGKLRVRWMEAAWTWAQTRAVFHERPTADDILILGYQVEPMRNRRGFRQTPVFIYDGWKPVVDWRNVPESVQALTEHGEDLTPVEFYTEFELIHPFLDGNGRVGVILYNWLGGTLARPEVPLRAGEAVFGPEERRAAMNYPMQGEEVGYVANPAFDMHWLSLVARLSVEGKAPTTETDFVGYIVEPDVGKHDCDKDDCRSCHNCGITGVDIDSEWNLCTGCASAEGAEDADAAEFEAQLDLEDGLEGCCAPWWEPCCTRSGRPL